MKRLLLSLALALALTLGCFAAAPIPPQRQLVFDEAGLFTAEEAEELQDYLLELSNQLSHDVAFASINGTGGQQLQFYAADFYDQQGIGSLFHENGALLMVDMEGRSLYLLTGGDLIDILTDERIDSILDAVLDQEGWYAGLSAYAREVSSYVAQGVPEDQHRFDTAPNRPAAPDRPAATPPPKRSVDLSSLLLSGGLALGVGGISCGAVSHRYRKPARQPYNAQAKSSLDLTEQADRFLRQAVTTRVIRRDPPPSSGGGISRSSRGSSSGRSTTFRSSSGRTRGGGGRRF